MSSYRETFPVRTTRFSIIEYIDPVKEFTRNLSVTLPDLVVRAASSRIADILLHW